MGWNQLAIAALGIVAKSLPFAWHVSIAEKPSFTSFTRQSKPATFLLGFAQMELILLLEGFASAHQPTPVSQRTARPQGYMSESFQRAVSPPSPSLTPEAESKNEVLAYAITRIVLEKRPYHRPTSRRTQSLCQEPDTPVPSESAPSNHLSPCALSGTGGQLPGLSAEDTDLTYDDMEAALPIVQLRHGWDAVYSLIQTKPYVLLMHEDFL
ncbi:hypothetical protein BKA59DRAFT_460122 [Fusarium tricinctum]|uniref:Uncharacterized protein n=1 Tax=Fusarium tricinctum TaxID=61284 RepID=A0A8K0W8X2_9HYPO|nr:hypothetical protein BKA59DRAFT_460122 [Fusarium tricinctum]